MRNQEPVHPSSFTMVKLLKAILLLLFCLPRINDAASDSLLSLNELIEEAIANNPELRALHADFEATESRISWFSHVADPLVAVEFANDRRMYSVTQQIPFPTKIAQRRGFAQSEAEYDYFLYIDKEQRVIRQVKQAYAELYLIHAKKRATEKSIAFLEQIHNIVRQKYSINEAPQAEVLMAQVQLAKAENQLILWTDDLMIAQANLNTLLNRDLEMILLPPGEIVETADTASLNSLYALAQQNQPLLKALQSKQEAVEIKQSLARHAYLPDLTFKYTYEDMNNDIHNSKYMVGLTVPLWFLDKQNKSLRESAAYVRGLSARYENLMNHTRLAVKHAKTRVEKYQHMIDLYENSVLPQTEAAVKSALGAYEVNKVDFQVLLESLKSLVEAEYDYEEARANRFIAMAELEETIGLSE
jgi:outer membrane protein TolC